MKRAIKAAWKGIQLSAVINLIMCIIIGLTNGPEKFASGYGMARGGAAAVLIGIGFGIPSMIYNTELRLSLKVLIHMGTGCLVMMAASVLGGWLPVESGLSAVLITLAIETAVAFAVWAATCIKTSAEAKRLNEKIKEKQQSE